MTLKSIRIYSEAWFYVWSSIESKAFEITSLKDAILLKCSKTRLYRTRILRRLGYSEVLFFSERALLYFISKDIVKYGYNKVTLQIPQEFPITVFYCTNKTQLSH